MEYLTWSSFYWFASLRYLIGQENSRHNFNQSDAKSKTNRDVVTRVFPRFKQVADFDFEFSLVNDDDKRYSDW